MKTIIINSLIVIILSILLQRYNKRIYIFYYMKLLKRKEQVIIAGHQITTEDIGNIVGHWTLEVLRQDCRIQVQDTLDYITISIKQKGD